MPRTPKGSQTSCKGRAEVTLWCASVRWQHVDMFVNIQHTTHRKAGQCLWQPSLQNSECIQVLTTMAHALVLLIQTQICKLVDHMTSIISDEGAQMLAERKKYGYRNMLGTWFLASVCMLVGLNQGYLQRRLINCSRSGRSPTKESSEQLIMWHEKT